MPRNRRWFLLGLFALANLVCWAGLATGVGLLVGDRVDLGIETLIRRGQGTVVALLQEAAQNIAEGPEPTATPWPTADANRPAVVTAVATAPVPTQVPSSGTPGTAAPAPSSAVTRVTPEKTATPAPTPTLIADPLLLADPEISSLSELDAELARSATDRAVQIRYQEETLNRELAALWHNNPDLPYRDVHVDLRREGVTVSGRVNILGFEVRGEVEGQVVAQNCTPQLKIKEVKLAGVMTPAFVRREVEGLVLEAMAWYPPDYPLCLEQIVLEETRATVYGYRR